MKSSVLAAPAIALALALSACGSGGSDAAKSDKALPTVAAPAGADWTQTVSKTADGGYRMGNPDAPIRLVEYAAVTCSHCQEFEEAAYDGIFTDFVKSGRVSFEVRNFLLNPYDLPISILTRCGDPSAYFPLTQQFYQNQRAILDKMQLAPAAELQSAFEKRDLVAAAGKMGILEFFKARGISDAQARACLTDTARSAELLKMTEHASNDLEVTGTPSFFINDAPYTYQGWPAMKQRLMDMGAR